MLKEILEAARQQYSRIQQNLFKHPYWDRFRTKDLKRRWDIYKFANVEYWFRDIFRGIWVHPSKYEPFQPVSAFNWPLYSSPRFNRELTKFMFSFRDESSTNKNINNLMFITGPEHSGKSWFLRQNIERFKKVQSGTVLFHLDLAAWRILNFEAFLDMFERGIIDELVRISENKFSGTEMLNARMVFDLLVYSHDRMYLDMKLTKMIEKCVKGEDLICANDAQCVKLRKILGKVANRLPKSTPVIDSFMEICEIFVEPHGKISLNKALIKSAIELAHKFYVQEEIESCPERNFAGLYRTGLKTTWFLLDLLNLIGGYHEMNILGKSYPHLLVVLEAADKILNIETAENRPLSWIEALAMRLYNDFGWRRHIPIIFEANGNYFNTQLYDDLHMLETAFPTIEWKGIDNQEQMFSLLSHVFNKAHIEFIWKHFGTNLHDLRIFTDGLTHTPEANPDFYKHLDAEGNQWDIEYNKFLYKINQIYLRPEVQFLLELNTLDYAILDTLHNFISNKGQITTIGAIGEEIKQKSIIKAFIELGLLYAEKHSSFLFSREVYCKFFQRYYKEKIKKMSFIEKLEYKKWVLFKGLHIKDMGVNRGRDKFGHYADYKETMDWDVDLYDEDVGKRDDPSKEGLQYSQAATGKLMFFSYGKFTEFPMIRYFFTPLQVFLFKVVNFPHAFMHLPLKHREEGNPEPALTSNVFKWLENRREVDSSLPQSGAEVRHGLYLDERERAVMKIAYIYDHPEMFRKPIKWRYIRRYARRIYMKNSRNDKATNFE